MVTVNQHSQPGMPWKESLQKLFDKGFMPKCMKGSLHNAADRIAEGGHEAKMVCWECSQVCEELKNFGKCEIAQYCSRDCQVKVWKEGHKRKCSVLHGMV